MHGAWLVASVLLTLLTLASCATTRGVPIPITDFRQIAGAWHGWVPSTSGPQLRASLVVETDGKYLLAVERNPAYPGHFMLERDGLRYGEGTTGFWRGKATLSEDRGRQYLRFVHDTGAFWMECERARP